MHLYSFTAGQLQGAINDGAVALLHALERDGLLARPADEIARSYAVAVYERGWFGKVWDRIAGKGDGPWYTVVSRPDPGEPAKEPA